MTVVVGIIHAGGTGERFRASSPKAFRDLDDEPIIDYSIRTMKKCGVGFIILTVPEGWKDYAKEKYNVDLVIKADKSRQHSSHKALHRCPFGTEIVVIHDAARPLIKQSVMMECINAVLDGADGSEPVMSPADTISKVYGKNIVEVPQRKFLQIAHTPQVFNYHKIMEAYNKHECHLDDFTDDMGVAVYSGLNCVAVRGTIEGYKLTYPYDYDFLTNLKYFSEAEALPMNVKNKRVLLFGASGGIGKEVRRLLEIGGAITDAPSSKSVDLSLEDLHLGSLEGKEYDIIINCAGIMVKNDVNSDKFEDLVNIHFRSCVNIVNAATELMPRGGNIVFVGSSAATSPRAIIGIYSAMKAAIVNFTSSAAELLKPHNIRVNCVSPARTKTKMMKIIGLFDGECLDATDVAKYIIGYANVNFSGRTVNIRKGMSFG